MKASSILSLFAFGASVVSALPQGAPLNAVQDLVPTQSSSFQDLIDEIREKVKDAGGLSASGIVSDLLAALESALAGVNVTDVSELVPNGLTKRQDSLGLDSLLDDLLPGDDDDIEDSSDEVPGLTGSLNERQASPDLDGALARKSEIKDLASKLVDAAKNEDLSSVADLLPQLIAAIKGSGGSETASVIKAREVGDLDGLLDTILNLLVEILGPLLDDDLEDDLFTRKTDSPVELNAIVALIDNLLARLS